MVQNADNIGDHIVASDCWKTKPERLVKTETVSGLSNVFTRYVEARGFSIYMNNLKILKLVRSLLAMIFVFSRARGPIGKELYHQQLSTNNSDFIGPCSVIHSGDVFEFLHVDINFPDDKVEVFSKFIQFSFEDEIMKYQTISNYAAKQI